MIKHLKLNLLSYLSSNPVLVIYSLFGTAIMTVVLQKENGGALLMASLIYGFSLGLPFCLGSEYLLKEKESWQKKALGTGVLLTVGFLFSYLLGDVTETKIHLLAIFYLLFLLAPPEVRSRKDLGFHWVIFVLAAMGMSISISMILLSLISFLSWVIKELFNIELPSIVEHLGLSFFSIFLPISLFGMLKPKPWDVPNLKYQISSSVEKAIRFLFTPVLLLYIFVLLCYVVKILIVGTLPKGMVSLPIAIAFTIYSILGSYIESRQKSSQGLWQYRDILNFCFIPLFITMAVGIFVRIQTYGFTTDRAYLLIIFLLMCSSLTVQIVSKSFDLRKTLVIAAALLLVTSFGPISPISLTTKSQMNRFLNILKKHGSAYQSLQDIKLEQWSQDEINRASSSLNKIFEHKKEDQLTQKAKEAGVLLPAFNQNIIDLKSRLNKLAVHSSYDGANKKCRSFFSSDERAFEISGYDYIQKFHIYSGKKFAIPNSEDALRVSLTDKAVYLMRNEKESAILKFEQDLEKYASKANFEDPSPFVAEASSQAYKVKLIIQSSNTGCANENLSGYILYKSSPK